MGYITFIDENLYRKKEAALKQYFRKAYKYLIFEVASKLKQEGKVDGSYEIELPTEEIFEKVYGKMKLLFQVKNDVAIIEDITPDKYLSDCFKGQLPIYHGIPYTSEKEKSKLKLVEKLMEDKQ